MKRPLGIFAMLAISLGFVLTTGASGRAPEARADALHHIDAGGNDYVEWSGTDCSSIYLHVHTEVPANVSEKQVLVSTANASDCHQTLDAVTSTLSSGVGPLTSTSSNFIHTSHTLQDVARIDIGWLRSSSKRFWNGTTTWWDESLAGDNLPAWAGSGTGTPWNHTAPSFTDVQWGCQTSPIACDGTLYYPRADFHTDFLHCNFINQHIVLQSAVRTYISGSYTVDFFQDGSCPGVFSATASKTNSLRTGGYGGGTSSVAICPVPGAPSVDNQVASYSCEFAS
jgi:hypothetical protein